MKGNHKWVGKDQGTVKKLQRNDGCLLRIEKINTDFKYSSFQSSGKNTKPKVITTANQSKA